MGVTDHLTTTHEGKICTSHLGAGEGGEKMVHFLGEGGPTGADQAQERVGTQSRHLLDPNPHPQPVSVPWG